MKILAIPLIRAVSAVTMLALLSGLNTAQAATLVVTTSTDPGSPICGASGSVKVITKGNSCSLRAAINMAAANDTVVFAIPASDHGCTASDTCRILLDAASGPLPVIKALKIEGAGQHITIAGPGTIQLLANSGPGLVINALTFSNGNCFDNASVGGTFHCFAGGGIANYGVLMVTNSTFSANSGGESCFSMHRGCGGADPQSGGAIANFGTGTVESSTFVDNSVVAGAQGAAIANFSGTLAVINSTFSGNSGGTTVFNGTSDCCSGYSSQAGSLVMTNSTLATTSGPGVANQISAITGIGPLTLSNTVLAGNSGGSCLTNPSYAAPTDAGGNLSDDATCGFTQSTSPGGTNPGLAQLQDNGGLTQTIALTAGSPAAAAGVASACPSTDQRGAARPGSGQNCSSGAVQYLTVAPPPGQLAERPNSVSFGTVTRLSRSGTILTVSNTGTVAVSIFGVSIVPGTAGSDTEFQPVSACPGSLAPGQNCRIGVGLLAQGTGAQSAKLLISSSALGSPQSIPLTAVIVP